MNEKYVKYILIAAGLFVAYLIIRKFLESLGVVNSAETNAGISQVKNTESNLGIWGGKAALFKKHPGKKIQLLTANGANGYAKDIHNALGIINDDETAIYTAFRSLRYQSQIASIVDAYRSLYNSDLLSDLQSHLNDSELGQVGNILKNLPLGIS